MGSVFDNLRDITFDTTKRVFGYRCSWTATTGGATYTGLVHFKNPTEEVRMQGVQYDQNDWQMEYREGDFPTLFNLVEERRDPPEVVNIDDQEYYVMSVVQIFDGATFRATLKPK